jgi:hemin uptake protein HemP
VTEQHPRRATTANSPDWIGVPVHRAVSSDDLMAGETVIIIQHGKDEYRLRLTASGKLILTK